MCFPFLPALLFCHTVAPVVLPDWLPSCCMLCPPIKPQQSQASMVQRPSDSWRTHRLGSSHQLPSVVCVCYVERRSCTKVKEMTLSRETNQSNMLSSITTLKGQLACVNAWLRFYLWKHIHGQTGVLDVSHARQSTAAWTACLHLPIHPPKSSWLSYNCQISHVSQQKMRSSAVNRETCKPQCGQNPFPYNGSVCSSRKGRKTMSECTRDKVQSSERPLKWGKNISGQREPVWLNVPLPDVVLLHWALLTCATTQAAQRANCPHGNDVRTLKM